MEAKEGRIFKDKIAAAIAPWLSVPDGLLAITFYKTAFGASEAYRLEDPDGGLVVRLSVEGADFWISQESTPSAAAMTLKSNTIRMILTVTNPDVLFVKAIQAGAKEVSPIAEDHGWRVGRLEDPFGLHWEIGRPVS